MYCPEVHRGDAKNAELTQPPKARRRSNQAPRVNLDVRLQEPQDLQPVLRLICAILVQFTAAAPIRGQT
jgi:hypothetical protein